MVNKSIEHLQNMTLIIFCPYRMFLRENGESKSESFHCSTLGWPQLEWFQKHFDSSANVEGIEKTMAIYESSLANNATFSELRSPKDRLRTRYLWKVIVSFSTPGRFSRFKERRKSIYKLLMICTCTTKLSWKSFRQPQRWLKRYFCWATKLPSLKFFMS